MKRYNKRWTIADMVNFKSLLEGKEKEYERANEAILDVVAQMGSDEVPTQVGAHLLLDRAISYCLHVFEHDDALKMIKVTVDSNISKKRREEN
jgi:hypothetical protein